MKLSQQIATINSKEELAIFVGALKRDLESNRESWENPTLERFLDAMEAWIESSQLPASPTWQTLAHILYASKIYE